MSMNIVQQTGLEAQLSDLEQGKWLYRHLYPIEHCTSETMRRGWQLAEKDFVRWYTTLGSNTAVDVAVVQSSERCEYEQQAM